MPSRTAAVAVLFLLVASTSLPAIFMRNEAQIVPVDRLVSNLERQIEASPGNIQARLNLARVHAMAYALKADGLPATKGKNDVARGSRLSVRAQQDCRRCPPGDVA